MSRSALVLLTLAAGFGASAASGPASEGEGPRHSAFVVARNLDPVDGENATGEWNPGRRAADEGAVLYRQTCSTCHGIDGLGLPPSNPPLAGHVPRLLTAPGGRGYLLRVPLFGIAGDIQVDGRRYSGVMSSFDFRRDTELAAILNYVLTAWGNDRLLPRGHEPLTAAEVATERARDLSAEAVRAGRPRLVSAPLTTR